MQMRNYIIIILAGATLCAQPRTSSDAITPYTLPPDLKDVSYGPYPRNVFDLWKAKSDRPAPIVIYFHPGGFGHGDKSGIEQLDKPLMDLCLKHGISVATANYRYVDHQVYLPAPMLDGARMVQFVRLHAKEWNVDPQAVILAGASSGAGISLWIGFHPDLAIPGDPDPVKQQSSRVCAIGSVDGQASYDPWVISELISEQIMRAPIIPALFGVKGEEMKSERARVLFAAASPLTYLAAGAPPTFLYYTQNVKPLPPANQSEMIHTPRFGVALKERMDKLGIECVLRMPKDYAAGVRRAFSEEMVNFFAQHCAVPKSGNPR
jgi:acetyl esterase